MALRAKGLSDLTGCRAVAGRGGSGARFVHDAHHLTRPRHPAVPRPSDRCPLSARSGELAVPRSPEAELLKPPPQGSLGVALERRGREKPDPHLLELADAG